METVSNATAAPLDVSAHVAAVELTAAEKKLVATVAKELRTHDEKAALAMQLASDHGGQGEKRLAGQITPEWDSTDVLWLAVACCLSGENAGRLRRRLRPIVEAFTRQILDKPELSDLAARVIDATAEAVRGDAKKHAEALAASPFASAGISDKGAQAAVAETLRMLGEQRGRAVRDPQAAWQILQDFGLTS